MISKPGELNPMYGKLHSEETKKKISDRMSKHPYGVGIYDLDDNLRASSSSCEASIS